MPPSGNEPLSENILNLMRPFRGVAISALGSAVGALHADHPMSHSYLTDSHTKLGHAGNHGISDIRDCCEDTKRCRREEDAEKERCKRVGGPDGAMGRGRKMIEPKWMEQVGNRRPVVMSLLICVKMIRIGIRRYPPDGYSGSPTTNLELHPWRSTLLIVVGLQPAGNSASTF